MDGYDWLAVAMTDVEEGPSLSVHCHLSPRATAPILLTRDDITVGSSRKAGEQDDIQWTVNDR